MKDSQGRTKTCCNCQFKKILDERGCYRSRLADEGPCDNCEVRGVSEWAYKDWAAK